MHAITSQDEQKILNCLGFENYARNRNLGITPQRYAHLTGCDVSDFEQQYQLKRISEALK